MDKVEYINIQVCFPMLGNIQIKEILVPKTSTIADALNASGLISESEFPQYKFGIFHVIKSLDSGILEGDRIEIYRPLYADPMESRRRRAKKNPSGKM